MIIVRAGFNKLILILAVRKAKHQIKILVLLKVTMTQTQEGFPLQQSSNIVNIAISKRKSGL